MSLKIKLEYGKSMYGGWYAQNMFHGIVIRGSTLKEIKEKIKISFPYCVLGNRIDN